MPSSRRKWLYGVFQKKKSIGKTISGKTIDLYMKAFNGFVRNRFAFLDEHIC
jgi:hypothetical protein